MRFRVSRKGNAIHMWLGGGLQRVKDGRGRRVKKTKTFTFAARKSLMNGSACLYVSLTGRGASPPTMNTSFRLQALTQAANSAA